MWFFLFLFFLIPTPAHATTYYQSSRSVSISASIGENEVTIYGYTSPNSKVELSGINVYARTYSQDNGYFEFKKTILPKNPSDLCLQSEDNYHRLNNPVCIAPPPATNYHTDIGPILLSPTITLEQDQINPNSTVITSGQSIPNSTLTVFFYQVNDHAKSFPKTALAYSLPPLKTITDAKGNYSLNLPTAYASNYRLYSAVEYLGNPSPKSNTLLYYLPSLFSLFIQKNSALLFLIPIIIFITFLLFLFLFLRPVTILLPPPTRFLPALKKFYPALRRPICLYPDSLRRSRQIPR